MTDDLKPAMTGDGTHRASQRGYARGELIEEGEMVPAGIVVSQIWMESAEQSNG